MFLARAQRFSRVEKEKYITIFGSRASTAMAVLLAAVLVYWLWFGLTQRYVTTDDIISTQAAQSILEHGFPRFPSGYLYLRGYTTHYMVAGAIWVLGFNNFSVMLPSLLMAIGSLWLTYLFARDVLGRPWLGIGASVLLAALDIQTFYATSPRMYMTFQFFTMLAVYSAWRGYVKGDKRFMLLTFLAVSAAILTHVEAGILTVSIPASIVLFTLWTKGKSSSFSALYSFQSVAGAVVVISVVFFRYVYSVPGAMPTISDRGGLPSGYDSNGLNLDPISWISQVFQLERALPFGLSLMLVTLFVVIVRSRGRQSDTDSNIIYPLLLLIISAIGIFLSTTKLHYRLWMFVLPLYALVLSYGIAALVEAFGKARRKEMGQRRIGKLILALLLAVGIVINLGFVSLAENTSYYELTLQGYGLPCTELTACDESIGEFYDVLRQKISPGDMIVTTNSFFTNYYLGRVDGYLREKQTKEGEFSAFDEPADEYYGIPLIDTRDELEGLLQEQRRVWIIADQKLYTFVSSETRRFIEENFTEIYSHGRITAYEGCFRISCDSAGSATQ